MARRKVINAALHNFLATFTSRNSDYEGYWVFGLLTDRLDGFDVSLVPPISIAGNTPLAFVNQLAIEQFEDQVAKAGLTRDQVSAAVLRVQRLAGEVVQNSWKGNYYQFTAYAVLDNDRTYSRVRRVFIAKRNPWIMRRSSR